MKRDNIYRKLAFTILVNLWMFLDMVSQKILFYQAFYKLDVDLSASLLMFVNQFVWILNILIICWCLLDWIETVLRIYRTQFLFI